MLFDIWQFHDATSKIPTRNRTLKLVNKLKKISKAHKDEFPPGKHNVLHDKVNNVKNGQNWMRVRVGHQSSTGDEVAIVYHRLKHAGQLGQPNPWSISVGPDESFMPASRINYTVPTDPTEPFVMLATEILDMVHSDFTTGKLDPGATLVIYDHVYPAGAVPPATGIQPDPGRRTTRIGELGWVSQQIIAASSDWNVIEPTHMVPRPTWLNPVTGTVVPIPGWGRDGLVADTYCIRTTLEPV